MTKCIRCQLDNPNTDSNMLHCEHDIITHPQTGSETPQSIEGVYFSVISKATTEAMKQ